MLVIGNLSNASNIWLIKVDYTSYYASDYGFGENGDCPAYVSGGGIVPLICCSQYFKSGMVGRHWQGIVQPDTVGENHIECVAAH